MSDQDLKKPAEVSGGCACGRVSYKSSTQPQIVCFCYCKTCQQCSGAPFLPFAAFKTSGVTWSENPTTWKKSEIAIRGHCPTCGSTVSMVYYSDVETTWLALGTVDAGMENRKCPNLHIFVKEKPFWYRIPDDGVPQCETFS